MVGLRGEAPNAITPNVRTILEILITVSYLVDPSAKQDERDKRLDRFMRAARETQVKLREAFQDYPILRSALIEDEEVAALEAAELADYEANLPKEDRLGRHWSSLKAGLRSMAELVGLGADYALQYRLHSGMSHARRPWDHLVVDLSQPLILPNLQRRRTAAVSIGFDALRYVAWILSVAQQQGAVAMYNSEQEQFARFRQFLRPIDTLMSNGTLASTRVPLRSDPQQRPSV